MLTRKARRNIFRVTRPSAPGGSTSMASRWSRVGAAARGLATHSSTERHAMQNTNANPLQPPATGTEGLSPRSLRPKVPRQAGRLLLVLLEMPLRYLFGRDLF